MQMIQNRQAEFFGYIGYSDMQTPRLENTFESYCNNLPTALNHIFLRPYISPNSSLKYNITSVDNFIVLGFIVVFLISFKRKNLSNAMFIAVLCYALSIYLFIGYTIPNCGALVRYKSEFTVLLLASLAGLSELPRFNNFLNRKLPGAE